MRFLTKSEIKDLDIAPEIPIDLKNVYAPVNLRIINEIELGGHREKAKFHFKEDSYEYIFRNVIGKLDCYPVRHFEKNDKGPYPKEMRTEFSWDHYNFSEQRAVRYDTVSQIVMFPLSHLLYERDLAPLSLKMRPGYLYIGCRFVIGDNSHSVMLDEPFYSELRRLSTTKVSYDKKGHIKNFENVPSEEEKNWKGPIFDIEQLTNSRVIYTNQDGGYVNYILETPLEFPPGFVRETLNALKSELPEDNKILKKFSELVLETPPPSVSEEKSIKQEMTKSMPFPQGAKVLFGPDSNWIHSSHPWFVQTVLLARLIGGDCWQYALGNLEASMATAIEQM